MEPIKVSLVSPPSPLLESPMPPLGLLYLGTIAEETGLCVRVDDLGAVKSRMNCIETIIAWRPTLIGLSVMSHTVREVELLVNIFRKRIPGILIIVGGPHVTERPLDGFDLCDADVVVCGEGEKPFKKLLEKLLSGQISDLSIPGVFTANNKSLLMKGKQIINRTDLESIPRPARHLIDFGNYSLFDGKGQKLFTLFTSRGCPGKCVFCCKSVSGSAVRHTPIASVIQEIQSMYDDLGARAYYFHDDCFTFNKSRLIRLCESIILNLPRIEWRCQARVDQLDLEVIQKMKLAGCNRINIGIESGCDTILKKIGKGITTDQVRHVVALCSNLGIKLKGYFIIGLPGDTEETMERTLSFAQELSLECATFCLATPLPGSKLWKIAGLDRQAKMSSKFFVDLTQYTYNPLETTIVYNFTRVPNNILMDYFSKGKKIEKHLREKNNLWIWKD
jgi:anaerobic magnesium-protoporphyrin IX monomethyl ester cyclase